MQVYDDRDRQGKVLSRWEKQKKIWAQIQNNLSRTVNRQEPNQTLPGSIHNYRQKCEETTLIDASIPPEFRIGSHGWEMSLRGNKSTESGSFSNGKSYVPFGISYPYPIFMTVGDGVHRNPESNSLMKVIPEYDVPPRNRSVSESQFVRTRQKQFKKNVQKTFSHFLSAHDHLSVYGSPAPATDQHDSVQEAITGPYLPPFTYHHMSSVDDRPNMKSQMTINDSTQHLPIDTDNINDNIHTVEKVGPSLSLSNVSLVKTVVPGNLAQLSLTANNTGTTAIFYNWIVRDIDHVPGLSPRPQDQCNFVLSDVSSGVLLPQDEKIFTFSFRPLAPGSYSETLELLTVPGGKDCILVHLQVFAVSEDENIAMTKVIEDLLMTKGIRDSIRCYLTESLWSRYNNPLSISNYKATTSVLRSLAVSDEKAHAELLQEQKRKWEHENSISVEVLLPAISAFVNLTQTLKDHLSHPTGTQNDTLFTNISQSFPSQSPRPTTLTDNEGFVKLYMPYNEILYGKMDNLYRNLYRYQRACDRITFHQWSPTSTDKITVNDVTIGGTFVDDTTSSVHLKGTPRVRSQHGHPRSTATKGESTLQGSTLEISVSEQKSHQDKKVLTAKEIFDTFTGDCCPVCGNIGHSEDISHYTEQTIIDTTKVTSPMCESGGTTAALSMVNRCIGNTCIPVWNGSIRCIIEDISKVRDATVRSRVLKALNLLLCLNKELGRLDTELGERKARNDSSNTYKVDSEQQCVTPSLETLITSIATKIAHDKEDVDFEAFAATAKEIATGRIRKKIIVEPLPVKSKGGKKTVAAVRPPVAPPVCVFSSERAAVISSIQDEHLTMAKKRIHVTTELLIAELKRYFFEVLSVVCDNDGSVIDAHRMDMIVNQLEVNQPDIDSLVDNTVAKKRR